ncbi:bifunctional diaminohydroxyphosphoribosylaminopyrimidine deaminase/5-amino-6-(5-phosphoribosylamino)uracil reductase RibD [Oryzifoliimicrobium ureilyticus]|uniref:bifunctional diaminohydroxyphosphoribosylaminopyrimidine deaminase/5-amino-6-(5-phosphoribosylamino)uracil reductase RibD n=1 Tax=Oryzifoliimicrobium ureilyticus TaxID=3113724 RepID=UPI00307608DF
MKPDRDFDRKFMAEAIQLGLTHLGLTGSNPSVGCLLVNEGVVVGRAVTAMGGRPHAETQALAQAGARARGATAYVSLEPCSHFGKTPPCAKALIDAGVARVVVSVMDPDDRVAGRGLAMLAEAGIAVESGVMEEEGKRSLIAYLTRQTKRRPYVTLKLAISADRKIGRLGEGQIAISGPEARLEVQRLRAETDAILVGIGTALADDPLLTVRLPGEEDRSPLRIVLDPQLSLPPSNKLVATAGEVPVIAVATEPPGFDDQKDEAFLARRATLDEAGVEILQCDPQRLDILLSALASRGISSLLVEGGAKTASRFLEAGLVDRIILYKGQLVIGERGIDAPVSEGEIPEGFTLRDQRQVGADQRYEFERDI